MKLIIMMTTQMIQIKLLQIYKVQNIQSQKLSLNNRSPLQDQSKIKKGERLDQFICNFFIKYQLHRSLEIFQEEWTELTKSAMFHINSICSIPDIYVQFEKLKDELLFVKGELERSNLMAEKASTTLQKLKQQRDFHKLNFYRAQQEKKQMSIEYDKLKQQLNFQEEKLQKSNIRIIDKKELTQEDPLLNRKRSLFKNTLQQPKNEEEMNNCKDIQKLLDRLPQVKKPSGQSLLFKPKPNK
ncbi:unnamed protein product (macronuclear) [Paramecium tetraurelia]|uniref:Uncharacterized protein n=1 Tax=Paramecium tetraurelia TaxID=5888 RepID=A0DJC2_PARTE|nr:uncharacterized protein GSPATT00017483001 [Paramecium tetraurelia]CAK83139.1 unnamed protein product [Paramecium tetraurelia]|eukprot:XP_001450536.1 hypothetical protein (macronuclear) [Paramecium tetraurelia strain d4-2]